MGRSFCVIVSTTESFCRRHTLTPTRGRAATPTSRAAVIDHHLLPGITEGAGAGAPNSAVTNLAAAHAASAHATALSGHWVLLIGVAAKVVAEIQKFDEKFAAEAAEDPAGAAQALADNRRLLAAQFPPGRSRLEIF
jgi:hypothetical protein